MGILQVSPNDFLTTQYDHTVFTQLDCKDYVTRKDGSHFELTYFFKNPTVYKSIFSPYTKVADIMINGIYWDSQAPPFFTNGAFFCKISCCEISRAFILLGFICHFAAGFLRRTPRPLQGASTRTTSPIS